MISTCTLEDLLEEARGDMNVTTEAARLAEERYGLCSNEFLLILSYRSTLQDEIDRLQKTISQVEAINRILTS